MSNKDESKQFTNDFKNIYRDELEAIKEYRQNALKKKKPLTGERKKELINSRADIGNQKVADNDLLGLALSGGGIRSATFNLGLMQALSNKRILKHTDYLSTVSGGGYIGACLTSLLNSETDSVGLDEDDFPLGREKKEGHEKSSMDRPPVKWLRYFSNFITAEGGFTSKYFVPAMVFIRGVILNLLLIIPFILALGLLLAFLLNPKAFIGIDYSNPCFFDLVEFREAVEKSRKGYNKSLLELRKYTNNRIAGPNGSSTISDEYRKTIEQDLKTSDSRYEELYFNVKSSQKPLKKEWIEILIFPSALFLLFIALALFLRVLYGRDLKTRKIVRKSLAIILMSSIFLLAVQLFGVLIVYWKVWEIGAWLSSISLLSFLVPKLLQGKREENTTKKSSVIRMALVVVLLALVPLLLLYAVGVVVSLFPYLKGTDQTDYYRILFAGLASGAIVLGYVNRKWINLNEISLHNIYRDRLSRAYLLKIVPNTNEADHRDDLKLSHINPKRSPYHLINTTLNLRKKMPEEENNEGIFRTGECFFFSKNWCGSKKTGYCPTWLYEGKIEKVKKEQSQDQGNEQTKDATREIKPLDPHINLGTAMAISGAAGNIGMAQHNIPYLRLLMGLFNIRLGYWALHPNEEYHKPGFWKKWDKPGSGAAIREWFGLYDLKYRYVNLSDGGHFENLGVYELLRRRCKYVIVGDAEADAAMTFQAISNLIRLARIDFGIDIEIDTTDLRKDHDTNLSLSHCTVGLIHYPEGHTGYLLYCKATLTGDEPEHLNEYKAKHPSFPHQTTADQWFDEQQFEAYRELGYHIGKSALKPLDDAASLGLEQAFNRLKEFWYPHSKEVTEHFTRHSIELNRIITEIKNDNDLSFIDEQFYPEWIELMKDTNFKASPPGSWLPEDPVKIRKGFYLCNQMIQLMENVYIDLNLEQQEGHPDNRGWMNLFRHWSWSGIFRITWTISASTFGARFQKFCENRLELTVGTVDVKEFKNSDKSWTERLNHVERDLIDKYITQDGFFFDRIYTFKLTPPALSGSQNKEFYFGFSLTNSEDQIVGFRIQDHLRRMGLGQKALALMTEKFHISAFTLNELNSAMEYKQKRDEQKMDAELFSSQSIKKFEAMCSRAGLENVK